MHLVLSLFPGLGLLDRGFENHGFCVVRSPDRDTQGGEIRAFNVMADKFDGVIAGPPCVDYSSLNRNPKGHSDEMMDETIRLILQAKPRWALIENVAGAPYREIEGYTSQRFDLNLSWFSEWSRLRYFVFYSRDGVVLDPIRKTAQPVKGGAVVGGDRRGLAAIKEIQGLPPDFDMPFFTEGGKIQAIANGVPIPMANYVAGLIKHHVYAEAVSEITGLDVRRCGCGCGRAIAGTARKRYFDDTCRRRANRAISRSR